MMRRTLSLGALVVVLVGVYTLSAQAAAGQLDSIIVTRPGSKQRVEVLGAMLDGQLSRSERDDFYDVVLGVVPARIARPEGDLGPASQLTYIFQDVRESPVKLMQTAYLEADPPVVFTPQGQKYEFYPNDVHPVSSGWRDLPEPAAAVLVDLIGEKLRAPGGTAISAISVLLMFVTTLVIAGVVFLLLRLRRDARPIEEEPGSDVESVVVKPGSPWLRALSVIGLFVSAVVLYFVGLGAGYGYQTCSGGRVVDRLPDGTPKTIVGPFECSEPDYWPWLYIVLVAYALVLTALVLTVIFIRRWMRGRNSSVPGVS